MAQSFEESYLPGLLEIYLHVTKEEEEQKNKMNSGELPSTVDGSNLAASAGRRGHQDSIWGSSLSISSPGQPHLNPIGGRGLIRSPLSKSMPELNSKFSTLRNVIGTEDIFKAFINFCIKCQGHENACFYMEAKIFENSIYPQSIMLTEVNRIIDLYVRSGSQMEINIDSETKNTIMNCLKTQTIDSTVFVKARKEIYSLMSRDLFTKWKSSKDFDRIKDCFKDS
jgi:hypothetical protein